MDTAKRERAMKYFMFLFVDYTSSKSMQEMQAVALKTPISSCLPTARQRNVVRLSNVELKDMRKDSHSLCLN